MKRRGFTLIELLVVIAIIGILAAAALIALSRSQAKARDATRKQDLVQVRNVLEAYQIDNPGTYPSEVAGGNLSGIATVLATQLDGAAMPNDPQPSKNYKYRNGYTTPTGIAWTGDGDTKYYTILAQLEAPKAVPASGKTTWWHVNSQGAPFENANGNSQGDF